MDHAGQGKIQRAPRTIREELNRRLMDGQLGPEILPWLNGLREINDVCAKHFAGEPVSAKNLSDYRTGAYAKWLTQRATMERQKELNLYALDVVKSSGQNLSEAAAALAAGRLIAAVEAIADGETAPEDLIAAINDLRKGDHKSKELSLKLQKLEQDDRALDLREEQSAWVTAGKILKALESREMQAVADSDADSESKMQDIVRIAFGSDLLNRIKASRGAALAP